MQNRFNTISRRVGLPALAAVLFVCAGAGIGAQEETKGFEASTDLELQISSDPGVKAVITQSFAFPFLRGNNPLTKGNSLRTALSAGITPVSLNGSLELIFSPLAFLELSGGAGAGSGWNISIFGGDTYGIGINTSAGGGSGQEGPRKAEIAGRAFDGLHWRAWGGGALQFDFAVVFPGDWNHVLIRTGHEAGYSAYTGANRGQPWVLEADDAENQNGWVYNSSYFVGYQLPLSPVLNLAGIMAEMRKNLYNTPGGDAWGDSLGQWTLSSLLNFSLTPDFNAALVIQMRTRRNYRDTDLENTDFYFYRDLELRENQPSRRLAFYRAALIIGYKLR